MSEEEFKAKGTELVKIEDEIQGAYLEYAMSVIIGRALPDVRDGLKPVHRRILWAMQDLGNFPDKKYLKSARVVGDVIGKYHPHGDSPVYGAMVRMAQDFAQRYTLVDGQGNFGSIDGDNAAAMRYTEARMSKIGQLLLRDIEKDTVDFGPNYDGSLHEPKVLPSIIPNLLVNGSAGIAVGMSTNIPPHNLGEILRGCLRVIEEPEVELEELMKIIPGPDFPTKGIITNVNGTRNAYRYGRGSFYIRGRAEIEPIGKEKEAIVVTEFPYMVNKANWIENLASLVREKEIEGITDIRDESNRQGIRVVVELRKGEASGVVLNTLFARTQLKVSFGVNMLAIDNGRPRVFNLKEYLTTFIEHRRDVVVRRCVFELNKAESRAHLLEGLKIALDNIDAVVELIKKAPSPVEARVGLQNRFSLSEKQAQAILDMRLQRLTALETEKLLQELAEVLKEIADLKKVLGSDTELMKVIETEFREILEKYADPRRSEISLEEEKEFVDEDFIRDEQVVVTISSEGYAKRSTLENYRAQGRGGKGIRGAATGAQDDYVSSLFVTSTLSQLLCFTNLGKLYWLKNYQIPEMSRTARGRPLVQLLSMGPGERVLSVLPVDKFSEDRFVFMATARGTVKKTPLMAFSNVRTSGIIALTIDEGDSFLGAAITSGKDSIFLASRQGQSITFSEDDVRPMGRTARGVRGMDLDDADQLVSMEILSSDDAATHSLLTVSSKGYGKRSPLEDYRVQGRGGSGIINLKCGDKIGDVVGVAKVKEDDDVMIISSGAQIIRVHVKNISLIGRATQGVRVISLDDGETVKAIAVVRDKEEDA